MGYVTSAEGEIGIEPPLTFAEIEDSPFLPDDEHARSGSIRTGRDVMFRLVDEVIRTDDGVLTKTRAVAIVQTWEDEPRNYSIVEHLQELVDRHGAGRTFTGRFDMEGEESGDLWRLKVVNGRATRFDPIVTWPAESEDGRAS